MATEVANMEAVLKGNTDDFKEKLGDAHERMKHFGESLKDIGKDALSFGLAQIGVSSFDEVLSTAKDTIGEWIHGAEEAQVAQARLNQILDSGQHVVGLTSDSVNKLVKSLADKTHIDDDEVQKAANTFAAMKSLSAKAYPEVTAAALQMARAQQLVTGGQVDALGASEALRNALEKPGRAMAVLRQYGIELSLQDQEQIKIWTKKKDSADIQALILKRVEDATKGAADAYGQTAQGKIEAFHTKMDNMGKALASTILPAISGLADAGLKLLDSLDQAGGPVDQLGQLLTGVFSGGGGAGLMKSVMQQVQPILQQVGGIFRDTLVPAVKALAPVIQQLVKGDLAEFQGIFRLIQPVLTLVGTILHNVILPVFTTLADVVANNVMPVLQQLQAAVLSQVMPAVLQLATAIEPIIELLGNILQPILRIIGWLFQNLIGPVLLLTINIIAGLITVLATVIGWFVQLGQLIGGAVSLNLNIIKSEFDAVSSAVQTLIGWIGNLLGGLGQIKDAVGGGLGSLLSHVPGFAGGTDDAPGGYAEVGEHGPELMYVPQHARIYPNGTGPIGASSGAGGSGSGGRSMSIGALHVYGDDAESTARAVVSELNWQYELF